MWTKSLNLGDRWVPGMTTVQAPSAYKVGLISPGFERSDRSNMVPQMTQSGRQFLDLLTRNNYEVLAKLKGKEMSWMPHAI